MRHAMIMRYTPAEVARRGWHGLSGVVELLTGLPRDLRRLARAARGGSLRLNVHVEELKYFGERIDSAASRLTIGMITAAFIIGTSIMLSVTGDTDYLAMSILAGMGFSLAALGGVWVLLSIWRGRH